MTTGATDEFTADFPFVRRGYDPDTVDVFLTELRTKWMLRLDQTTSDMAILQKELEEARRREEAIHLTFVAATRTKEEMLEAAGRELDEARAVAKEDADRIVSEAQYEAFRIVTEARQEAEAAITEARRDADTLRNSAADEGASLSATRALELRRLREEFVVEEVELRARVDRMRSAIDELEQRLQRLACGALEELGSMERAIRVETEALNELAGMVPVGRIRRGRVRRGRPAPRPGSPRLHGNRRAVRSDRCRSRPERSA